GGRASASPPLSWDLRASPGCPPRCGVDRPVFTVGGGHCRARWARGRVLAFQSRLSRTVRVPERFRGGVAPSAPAAVRDSPVRDERLLTTVAVTGAYSDPRAAPEAARARGNAPRPQTPHRPATVPGRRTDSRRTAADRSALVRGEPVLLAQGVGQEGGQLHADAQFAADARGGRLAAPPLDLARGGEQFALPH